MSKLPRPICLFLVLFCARCLADTVTLVTGEKLEGKITSETASDITMEVKVSDTISDEKTVQRSEIQKIEKTPPDEIAYQAIKALKPDPYSAQQTVIDQAITTLNAFAKYPLSARAADVRSTLDAFQKDKDALNAGKVKFYGNWITKEEAVKRAMQIEAQTLFSTMKAQVAQGDMIAALNTFDQLEKDCSGSRAYPDAVALTRQILNALMQQVGHSQQVLRHDMEVWTQGVAITAEPQKSQIIAAQKAEQDRYDAILAGAKDKWPPLIIHSDKSLNTLSAEITTENARLAALPLDKMNASLECAEKARMAIAGKDMDTAESLLKEAATLWPQNERVKYLEDQIADSKAADARQAADKAAAAALAAKKTPTPKPVPATPPPAPAQQVAANPAPAADEDKPSILAFFMTVPGGLCIVGAALALIGIVAVVQKVKKPKGGQA